MNKFADERYRKREGLRWWPETELVRWIGQTYGATNGVGHEQRRLALDLGCGTGRNSWLLHEAGFDVHSIDDSDGAITVATEYMTKRVPGIGQDGRSVMIHADMLTFLKDRRADIYDLVIDCQTIQHLSDEDHRAAYTEIWRVLKPKGRFWSMHFGSGDSRALYGGAYPELHPWTISELSDMVARTGLVATDRARLTRGSIGASLIQHLITAWRKP